MKLSINLCYRHYLHLPSMTSEEIDSLKVAACEDDNQDNFEFVEPLYIDDDFVVVEQKWFAWFLVRKSRAFQ